MRVALDDVRVRLEAEPGALGDLQPPVRGQGRAAVEFGLEVAVEAFQHGRRAMGRVEMHGRHLAGAEQRAVGHVFDVRGIAEGGDLDQFRHAPGLGHVGLRDVDGPGVDHGHEIMEAAGILAAGDAVAARRPHPGQTAVVLRRPYGLFQPIEAKRLQFGVIAERLLHRPRAVDVEHDDGVVAGRLAGGRDLRHRHLVELDIPVAPLHGLAGDAHDVVHVAVAQKAGVDFELVGKRPAQQVDQGLSASLAADVARAPYPRPRPRR